MQRLNYNSLFYFHTIASEGSIAGAAELLGLSNSTLSEQLRQLEAGLRTSLFERRNARLTLTDAGRRAFRYTRVMFKASERLLHAVSPQNSQKITLDVGVSSTVSRSFAAEYFVPLFEDPGTHVRLKQGDYDYLIDDLKSFQLDILLSDSKPGDTRAGGLVSEPVQRAGLVVVGAKEFGHLFAGYPGNVPPVPFLHFSLQSHYRWEVDQYFERLGVQPNVLGEVDDVLLMRSAVLKGVCCAALPETIVEGDLRSERAVLLDRVPLSESALYVTYHSKEPTEHILRAVALLRGAH